jgi:hypothetical protein
LVTNRNPPTELTMRTLKSLFAATVLVSLTAASGCVKQDAAPAGLAKGIPTSDQVAIKLPIAKTKSIGQLADYYVTTRNVTRMFNGGTAWVLTLIHAIVQYPVTNVVGNVYTWGPWTDALNPAEYQLQVTALADGTFDYVLSGRNKTVAGSTFITVIDGHSDPRPGENLGNGSFLLDMDASRIVNPIDSGDGTGQLTVHFDLAARHLDLGLAQATTTADYAYDEAADGSGDMTFDFQGDVNNNGSALENIQIRSRWLPTGAGRGDARVTGGDIAPNVATASECWDTTFGRVFFTDSWGAPEEGTVGACAFANVDLPPAP